MPIRKVFEKAKGLENPDGGSSPNASAAPEFTFMRSTTYTNEVINPPSFGEHDESPPSSSDGTQEARGRLSIFHRSRSGSTASTKSQTQGRSRDRDSKSHRLSQRLGIHRHLSSSNLPENLPDIPAGQGDEGAEDQWEQRATLLAKDNQLKRSRPSTPVGGPPVLELQGLDLESTSKPDVVSSKAVDENIQEAIRLHESGDLARSTQMFGRLADPDGDNNALSQVLYGLALRHGWGCNPDPQKAITYLTAAASNAASIETLALDAGLKKGGAAKGELVLAIFELANCFRQGWGVEKDPVAAKQYYETAANLGDTDAMNEVAWCYLEGFGCKKDKYTAAKYYRQAENGGNKTLGNSWIWKPKYDPK